MALSMLNACRRVVLFGWQRLDSPKQTICAKLNPCASCAHTRSEITSKKGDILESSESDITTERRRHSSINILSPTFSVSNDIKAFLEHNEFHAYITQKILSYLPLTLLVVFGEAKKPANRSRTPLVVIGRMNSGGCLSVGEPDDSMGGAYALV